MEEFDPKKKPEIEVKPKEADEDEETETACSAEFADGCIINDD